MIERGIADRFCVYWWNNDGGDGEYGENWMQKLACLIGWPVPLETEHTETLDGGGA